VLSSYPVQSAWIGLIPTLQNCLHLPSLFSSVPGTWPPSSGTLPECWVSALLLCTWDIKHHKTLSTENREHHRTLSTENMEHHRTLSTENMEHHKLSAQKTWNITKLSPHKTWNSHHIKRLQKQMLTLTAVKDCVSFKSLDHLLWNPSPSCFYINEPLELWYLPAMVRCMLAQQELWCLPGLVNCIFAWQHLWHPPALLLCSHQMCNCHGWLGVKNQSSVCPVLVNYIFA